MNNLVRKQTIASSLLSFLRNSFALDRFGEDEVSLYYLGTSRIESHFSSQEIYKILKILQI
jgi:hypothetical protein